MDSHSILDITAPTTNSKTPWVANTRRRYAKDISAAGFRLIDVVRYLRGDLAVVNSRMEMYCLSVGLTDTYNKALPRYSLTTAGGIVAGTSHSPISETK